MAVTATASGVGVCGGAPDNPCTQVTICQPGTSTCQTTSDILVDTGSFGLRIFQSALSVPLLQTIDNAGLPVGECVAFADSTAAWGPVQIADVVLGGEPAVRVPIQVINSGFGGLNGFSNGCGSGVTSLNIPSDAAANGILGIGFYQYDAGPYYSCTSTTCTSINTTQLDPTTLANPVQNPVFLLPTDYNGVILTFPAILSTGAPSVSGNLILGIGTKSNNSVGPGILMYPAVSGSLTTIYGLTTNPNGYIDSGTNGLSVPPDFINPVIPNCPTNTTFLCPVSLLSLSASNQASNGLVPVLFQIGNADSLFSNSSNNVFNDIAFYSPSTLGNNGFIWGFPFFMGRTIYIGYDSISSPIGTGPFWAY